MLDAKKASINRREFIAANLRGGLLIATFGIGSWGILWFDRQLFLRSEFLQMISPDSNWCSFRLLKFLEVLDLAERTRLVKSFEENYNLSPIQILEELRWTSSKTLTYLFRHKFEFGYNVILQKHIYKLGIAKHHVDTETAFALEARMLYAIVKIFH